MQLLSFISFAFAMVITIILIFKGRILRKSNRNLLLMVTLILLIVGTVSCVKQVELDSAQQAKTEQINKQKKAQNKKTNVKNNKKNTATNNKINNSLNNKLSKDKASSKPQFYYLKNINKIEYKNNQIHIYVNDEFINLPTNEKNSYIVKIQKMALDTASKFKKVSKELYSSGIYTYIYNSRNKLIGQSNYSQYNQIKWSTK